MFLPLISCNKWLDVNPQTQVPTEDMFAKESGFEGALTGCYIKMNSTSLYGMSLTMSDIEFPAQMWAIDETNHKNQITVRDFNYDSEYSQGVFKSIYNGLYNIILQANDILEHIDAAGDVVKSEVKRNVIKGEALAIRAFCHFDLLRIFGQVPQNATKQVSLPYAETTGPDSKSLYAYNDYVKKIADDLNNAENLLKNDPSLVFTLNELSSPAYLSENGSDLEEFYQYRKFRFNYWAVKALQARFYLYTGDTQNANQAAMDIINAELENGTKCFTLAGSSDFEAFNMTLPSETIMALSNSNLEEYAAGMFSSSFGSSTLPFTKERKEDLFRGRNIAQNNRYTTLWSQYTNSQGSSFPLLQKYIQEKTNSTTSDATKLANRWQVPLLRLSEVYLIAMETAPSLTDANTLYKDYMLARNEQVGGFSSISDLKNEIINEYRREFIAEGQMFFTYKRLLTKTMLWRIADVVEENYVIPVPVSENTK